MSSDQIVNGSCFYSLLVWLLFFLYGDSGGGARCVRLLMLLLLVVFIGGFELWILIIIEKIGHGEGQWVLMMTGSRRGTDADVTGKDRLVERK